MAKRFFTGMASAAALISAGGAAQACDQHGGFGFSASFYEYYAALEEAAGEQETLEAYNEKLKTEARTRFLSRFNVQPLQQEASAPDASASEETFTEKLAGNDEPDA